MITTFQYPRAYWQINTNLILLRVNSITVLWGLVTNDSTKPKQKRFFAISYSDTIDSILHFNCQCKQIFCLYMPLNDTCITLHWSSSLMQSCKPTQLKLHFNATRIVYGKVQNICFLCWLELWLCRHVYMQQCELDHKLDGVLLKRFVLYTIQ